MTRFDMGCNLRGWWGLWGAMALFAVLGLPAGATTNVWQGLGDGVTWGDASNWSNGVPGASDTAVFGEGAAPTVLLGQDRDIASLNMALLNGEVASLTFGGGAVHRLTMSQLQLASSTTLTTQSVALLTVSAVSPMHIRSSAQLGLGIYSLGQLVVDPGGVLTVGTEAAPASSFVLGLKTTSNGDFNSLLAPTGQLRVNGGELHIVATNFWVARSTAGSADGSRDPIAGQLTFSGGAASITAKTWWIGTQSSQGLNYGTVDATGASGVVDFKSEAMVVGSWAHHDRSTGIGFATVILGNGGNTNKQALAVTGSLSIGVGGTGRGALRAAANGSLVLGTPAAPLPRVLLGQNAGGNIGKSYMQAFGTLEGRTGSRVRLHAGELVIGLNDQGGATQASSFAGGTVDFLNVPFDGVVNVMNVSTVLVGSAGSGYTFINQGGLKGHARRGRLRLGPGSVTVDVMVCGKYPNLSVGQLCYSGDAALTLNGTAVNVRRRLDIYDVTTIDVQVNGLPAGLVLDSGASMVVSNTLPGPQITMTFKNPSSSFAGAYSGFSWGGNHLIQVQDWITAGVMAINNTMSPQYGTPTVFYHVPTDATYVGILVEDLGQGAYTEDPVIAGLYLLQVDGTGASAGRVAGRWNLTDFAFGSHGVLLLGSGYDGLPLGQSWAPLVPPSASLEDPGMSPSGALLDEAVSFLLVRGLRASVTNGFDLDTDDNGVLDTHPWLEVLDSVAWSTGVPLDTLYGPVRLLQGAGHPAAATRFRGDRGNSAASWYHGDVMTTATDRRGRTYDPVAASANMLAGALLTPGRLNFPIPGDIDADLLPDTWEQFYFFGPTLGDPEEDSDADTMINLDEFLAGTNPTTNGSVLQVVNLWGEPTGVPTTNRLVLLWDSASNRTYTIYRTTNAFSELVPLVQNIPATPPQNVYTNIIDGAAEPLTGTYRIGVDPPPAWDL